MALVSSAVQREQGSSESRGHAHQEADVDGARLRAEQGAGRQGCRAVSGWREDDLGVTWLQCKELIRETRVCPARSQS